MKGYNLYAHTTPSEDKDSENLLIDDIQQTVFPVQSSGSVQRTLVIDWLNLHPENWTYILSLLKVFNNLLKIIDEKDRDPLTGLLNRNTFDNNLENIINYSKQQSRKARNRDGHSWIAILDVDHFKKINDKYGHIMGDEVMRFCYCFHTCYCLHFVIQTLYLGLVVKSLLQY